MRGPRLERFFGNFPMKMDDKGRVQVPADFRAVLDANDPDRDPRRNPALYVLFGDTRNPWLTCHSEASMRELVARLDKMPAAHPAKAAMEDALHGQTERMHLDDAGRISLSKRLRDQIGLDRAVLFKALGKHFRMMSPEVPAPLAAPLTTLLSELPPEQGIESLLPDL